MRIVERTKPASMAVVVDTILAGKVTLTVEPLHLDEGRIDIVYVRKLENSEDVITGVLIGPSTKRKPLRPALATGMRKLAEIHLPAGTHCILQKHIREVP